MNVTRNILFLEVKGRRPVLCSYSLKRIHLKWEGDEVPSDLHFEDDENEWDSGGRWTCISHDGVWETGVRGPSRTRRNGRKPQSKESGLEVLGFSSDIETLLDGK